MLMAVGGIVVLLWQGGVCVYRVWLCSSSRAINHSFLSFSFWILFVFTYRHLEFYVTVCMRLYEIVISFKCHCIYLLVENVHVCVCVCVYVCVFLSATETDNQEIKRQRGEEKSLFCCRVLFIYFALNCHTPSSRCWCSRGPALWYYLGGRANLHSSWSSKGSFVEGGGSLLGDPSQSFSAEPESARSSLESFPPVFGRKCFFKCSYNTLSQRAPHTHSHRLSHTHTRSPFFWLIQILTHW